MRKWLGYIDQYILFPIAVKRRVKKCVPDTLFVFTDHALGPWVPLVANHSHIIHCHDFLAQQSAKGTIKKNPTGWTGRQYQAFIRLGYSMGKHFISVSEKTRDDLHSFLPSIPVRSEVVYNGVNKVFQPHDPMESRIFLSGKTGLDLRQGYILHIGGNQWYKNRVGVIQIYNAWRSYQDKSFPLIMGGKEPDAKLLAEYNNSSYKADIHFMVDLDDSLVRRAYSGAKVFLFPSIGEGFGWPIAEAMACGCPVITTNAAPMTEVAGNAGFLIPVRPGDENKIHAWTIQSALVLNHVLRILPADRIKVVEEALINARRFDAEVALNRIESIYKEVLSTYTKPEIQSITKKNRRRDKAFQPINTEQVF
jgi:glycosyltransferase involved in cell wall biosynthesis